MSCIASTGFIKLFSNVMPGVCCPFYFSNFIDLNIRAMFMAWALVDIVTDAIFRIQ